MDRLIASFYVGIGRCHALLMGLHFLILQLISLTQYCQNMSTNLKHFCGQLRTYEVTRITRTFDIHPLNGYTTEITYQQFDMLHSRHCGINVMTVWKMLTPYHKDHYCGSMPPWNETCLCKKIRFQLVITLQSPPTEIVMSYGMRQEPVLTTYTVVQSRSRWHRGYMSLTPM